VLTKHSKTVPQEWLDLRVTGISGPDSEILGYPGLKLLSYYHTTIYGGLIQVLTEIRGEAERVDNTGNSPTVCITV